MKLLAFAGEKQSGKSSASNFVHGFCMRENGVIRDFNLDDDGNLLCNTVYSKEDGTTEEGWGILDVRRKDYEFSEYAVENIWPYARNYSFADRLKEASAFVFGLELDKLYGTNEDKNSPTHIKWADLQFAFSPHKKKAIKDAGKKDKYMTYREFLEVFGTDVCRKILDSCWIDRCLESCANSMSEISLIDDCRFINEVKAIQAVGGKVILFTKSIFRSGETKPVSEQIVDLYEQGKFKPDAVIDNHKLSIFEKNQKILDELYRWGWLNIKPVEA